MALIYRSGVDASEEGAGPLLDAVGQLVGIPLAVTVDSGDRNAREVPHVLEQRLLRRALQARQDLVGTGKVIARQPRHDDPSLGEVHGHLGQAPLAHGWRRWITD